MYRHLNGCAKVFGVYAQLVVNDKHCFLSESTLIHSFCALKQLKLKTRIERKHHGIHPFGYKRQ